MSPQSEVRRWLSRVAGVFRRQALDRQLNEEVRFHLDMEAEANRRRGMSAEEAARAARRAFGGAEQVKEIYRDRRGLPAIEMLFKDIRYGLRTMRRSPGFTAIAALSLALGIGANTAIFTLMDAVMWRSLPVPAPEELVSVGDASRPTALSEGAPMLTVLSYPLYARLRDQNRVFRGLMAAGKSGPIDMNVDEGSDEPVRGRLVSGNYFDVLAVAPALGRTFAAGEDEPAAGSPVAVISYDFWQNRFAGDRGILGRTLRLNRAMFTIIGVGPRGFSGEVVGSPTDIWIPLAMQPRVNPGYPRLDNRNSNWLIGMGRLKPGVSLARARAQIAALAQEALMDYTGANLSPDDAKAIRSQTIDVEPGGRGLSWIRGHDRSLLVTLAALFGLVLAIACANVANLLLARASKRQKEISMRLALGAGRPRLIRQLLTESVLLAAIGGSMGLLMAGWGSRILSRLAAVGGVSPIPFDVDVRPHIAVLAFTGAVSVLTALLFGLAPALRSTRIDLAPALKEGTRTSGAGGGHLARWLVVAQLGLSIVMLTGAGLLMRSLANLETRDVGYSRANLVLVKADFSGSGYTSDRQLAALNRLMEHLRATPGVRGVTVSENGLFSATDSSTDSLQVEGFTPARREDASSGFDQVGAHYFQVVGVPLVAGRDFDERDRLGAQAVVIINETMARFYFAGRDTLGKYLANGGDRAVIVGVARDMKQRNLKAGMERRFYLPLLQSTDRFGAFNLEIRTRDDAARMIPATRRALQSFDRNLRVTSLQTVRVLMDESISADRMMARLAGFFGVLALLLAASGLYGVISYATARRTNEIGVRIALGAGRGTVVRMVLGETLVLAAAGFAIGLPAALLAGRLIGATLVGVSARDPLTFGAASGVMLLAALCAGFIPAERASRIDPMVALRQD